MTKHIRIENADNSDHKVRVYIEDQTADGTWVRTGQADNLSLDFPTAMVDATVWSNRRLVIEEVKD